MGYRKKMIWASVVLMLLLCVTPAVQANATEADGLWVRMHTDNGGFVASICVNTTVADGLIEVWYDSTLITFTEVVVDNQYVAAHAVNAEEPGVVKIAWVAPGDYGQDGNVHILMQVRFTNAEGAAVELTGGAHGPNGSEVPVTELNFTVLSALTAAEAYKAEDYTEESFAALKKAIENAWAAMGDLYTSQADMDAAAAAVMAAIDGLERAPVVVPTEPTEPTQPEPTEPTQPATKPTQPTTQPTTQPVEPTPGPNPGSGLWIGIVAAIAVAGVAIVVIMKKKEVRK